MKISLQLIFAVIFASQVACAEELFTETAVIESPVGFIAANAKAAREASFVVLDDGGMEYWLFDVQKRTFGLIAKNAIGDWEHHLNHTQWSNDKLILFRSWEETIDIVDPGHTQSAMSIPAEIKAAPLRMSFWIDQFPVLIDGTDFYRYVGGTIKLTDNDSEHTHTVQTGLIVDSGTQVITSGFHDETIKIWSLPEGNLLHDWSLSVWFGRRQITAIALVHGRLLVGMQNGRLEERSLQTGDKLWSARPCNSPINFHYSSQFSPSPSINVDDGLFLSCATHLSFIEPQQKSWRLSDFDFVTESLAATKNADRQTAKELIAVETIPNTNLAILIFGDGSSVSVDKKQERVLQSLAAVKPGTAPVTYIAATKQLFLVDDKGRSHLYQLGSSTTN